MGVGGEYLILLNTESNSFFMFAIVRVCLVKSAAWRAKLFSERLFKLDSFSLATSRVSSLGWGGGEDVVGAAIDACTRE